MGGLVGGKGGPSTHTTTSEATLPPWLTDYFQGAAGAASDLYAGGGPQYYPHSTVVPHSAQTLTGLTTTEGLAMDPSLIPGYGQAFQEFQDTLSGKYLYGGEGFEAALDAAQRDILPRVNSTFNAGGRTSSGLAQAAMAEELGDTFAGMYQTERSRQDAARSQLPMMLGAAFQPAQAMMGVGSTLEGKQRENLMDEVARWNFEQQAPTNTLNQYLSQLGGIAPFYQSQRNEQPVYDSGGSGLLGTALSLGSMFLDPTGGAVFPASGIWT